MVFGNMGDDSGTGVAFTRNPSTGENALYGEYLLNAQGEDVVAGIRTPQKIAATGARDARRSTSSSRQIAGALEKHYRDMQDLEFTIERGKLYMLQTRTGKRTAQAAVEDRRRHGQRGPDHQGRGRACASSPLQIEQLLHRRIDPSAKVQVIAKGLNASPGAATGKAIFDADTRGERWPSRARRSSSSAPRPAPTTSTACSARRAS